MELQNIVDAFPIDYENFRDSENEITYFLDLIGYTEIRWWSSDYDSFGPLVRTVKATNAEGNKEIACYA